MIERWVLFYDGACPLCFKTQSNLVKFLPDNIRITAVDINSNIAKHKGYTNKNVILETPDCVYIGHKACLKILSHTKYNWLNAIILRPIVFITYQIVSKNRKLISLIVRV